MADLIASIGIIVAIYLLVMGLMIMWNKEDKGLVATVLNIVYLQSGLIS